MCIQMLAMFRCSSSLLAEYLNIVAYLHGGSELFENHHKKVLESSGQPSKDHFMLGIVRAFPYKFQSIVRWIKKNFSVEYTIQGVVNLLNRLEFTYNENY